MTLGALSVLPMDHGMPDNVYYRTMIYTVK